MKWFIACVSAVAVFVVCLLIYNYNEEQKKINRTLEYYDYMVKMDREREMAEIEEWHKETRETVYKTAARTGEWWRVDSCDKNFEELKGLYKERYRLIDREWYKLSKKERYEAIMTY